MSDTFSKITSCVPLKIKYGQTITVDFSTVLTTSKRKPIKLESDRVAEFYNCFSKLLESQNYTSLLMIY